MLPSCTFKHLLAFLLIMMLPILSIAQSNSAELAALKLESEAKIDLSMAISTALANNHNIKRSMLDVRVAKQDVLNAWAAVMPDVSTSMNYTRNLEIPVNFVPAIAFDPNADPNELIPLAFGTDNNWTGGLVVTQNIFKGEALVGISSAEIYLSAQQEGKRQVAQQVVTETRIAFANVLYAEQNLKLQQNIIDRLKENLRQNKARVEAGLLDAYEVLRLEVTLSNQEPQLAEARFALDQAYRQLSITMGLPADFKIPVVGDLSSYNIMATEQEDEINQLTAKITEAVPLEERFPTESLLRRSDIIGLNIQRQLKIKETQAYKSRFLPTITADYALQWTAAQPGTPNFFGESNQRARFQTLGFTISMPLFSGLSRTTTVQKAILERKNIELQQDQAKQMANAQILELREAFDKIQKTADARTKALEQAKRGYQIAFSRFEQGLGTQLDVDEANEQMQAAETNFAAMVLEYLQVKAQYDQAIGQVPFVDLTIATTN